LRRWPHHDARPNDRRTASMRSVKLITAATIVSELGDISRFENPRQLMAYAGMVPSEHSSGGNIRRGSITKTGNAHLRRVIVETAWHYRHAPGRERRPAQTPTRSSSTSLHDCLECTTTAEQTLSPSSGSWENQASDRVAIGRAVSSGLSLPSSRSRRINPRQRENSADAREARAFMSARAVYAATDGQGPPMGNVGTTFVGRSGRGRLSRLCGKLFVRTNRKPSHGASRTIRRATRFSKVLWPLFVTATTPSRPATSSMPRTCSSNTALIGTLR
jgi:hypothetical protein